MRPRERWEMLRSQVEEDMAKRKELDHHWEDLVDVGVMSCFCMCSRLIILQNPYQPTPVTYASRLWRAIQDSHKSSNPGSPPRPRAARIRFGRGGCVRIDRHLFSTRPVLSSSDSDDSEKRERFRRAEEQWRYDDDDAPVVGLKGAEEQNRQLVDDFDVKYV